MKALWLLVLLCVSCGGIDLEVLAADCGAPDVVDPCTLGPGCVGGGVDAGMGK